MLTNLKLNMYEKPTDYEKNKYAMSEFRNFHRIIIYSLWGYFLKNFKKFHRFIEELYARLMVSMVCSKH